MPKITIDTDAPSVTIAGEEEVTDSQRKLLLEAMVMIIKNWEEDTLVDLYGEVWES